MAQEALAAGAEAILVGGGDGTVGEVARVLAHTHVPLGVLPIGAFNNIARSLGIPSDLAAACAVVAQGLIRHSLREGF